MKKLSFALSAALGLALCAAPSAQAGTCGIHQPPGDPVFDPGSSCKIDFSVSLEVDGAYALVKGYTQSRTVRIETPSFLKDTADDGLEAHLWVRTYFPDPMPPGPYEELVTSISGNGSTIGVDWSADLVEAFEVRVCVGEGTAKCSQWR